MYLVRVCVRAGGASNGAEEIFFFRNFPVFDKEEKVELFLSGKSAAIF